jgi:geranylgeranylglycerol-phosphate geranylgeranyltransferase
MQEIRNTTTKSSSQQKVTQTSFAVSQLLLLQSRKRWGIMYMLATLSGLFIPIGGIFAAVGVHGGDSILMTLLRITPLPAATFLIITGMYVLNDLVDADLDSANGKKRPIPSGQVTKAQARIFVIITNAASLTLVLITFNLSILININSLTSISQQVFGYV